MPSKIRWTIEKIAEGFEKFNAEHGRYPTSFEIDQYPDLPSSRQIQRQYGGLPNLRGQLKLSGPQDFTKGEYSSLRAKTIGKRAHQLEKKIYDYLVEHFGVPFVHREYFFVDDRRSRTDFFIYHKNGNFSVDVFFPKDKRNLTGCLNSKMRTYSHGAMIQYPVIFLMMNEEISKEEVMEILSQKRNKLKSFQIVMTYAELVQFCKSKESIGNDIGRIT